MGVGKEMTDELVSDPKSLLITFDLQTAEDIHAAYVALAELGFVRVEQNVLLPTKTVIGTWFGEGDLEKIRDSLLTYLHQKGTPVARILVAEFIASAWRGTSIP